MDSLFAAKANTFPVSVATTGPPLIPNSIVLSIAYDSSYLFTVLTRDEHGFAATAHAPILGFRMSSHSPPLMD